MPEAYDKIFKFNEDKKSFKVAFVIWKSESLLRKVHTCDSNPEDFKNNVKNKQTYVVWVIIHRLFHFTVRKSKHDFYIGEDSMMSFGRKLWELPTEIINCEQSKSCC